MKLSPKAWIALAVSAVLIIAVIAALFHLGGKDEGDITGNEVPSSSGTESGFPSPPTDENATVHEPAGLNATGHVDNGTIAPSPAPEENEPGQAPEPDVKMITFDFVEDLAKYVVANYHPAHSHPRAHDAGISTLSFQKLNMRYGLKLTGFEVGGPNLRQAREELLDYVLHPVVLETAYRVFSTGFVDALVYDAENSERTFTAPDGTTYDAPLDKAQCAEMLVVSAAKLRQVAAVFATLAKKPALIDTVANYRQAQIRVQQANTRFQRTLKSLSGTDSEFESVPQWQRKKEISRTGAELKNAVVARERIKNRVVEGIEAACGTPCRDESNKFYIAQWIYRRVEFRPETIDAIKKAAAVMDDLASDMDERARSLEN